MITVLTVGHSESGGGMQTVLKINNRIHDKEIYIVRAFHSDENNLADIELMRDKDAKNKLLKLKRYFYIHSNYKSIKDFLLKNNVDIIHLHGHGHLSLSIIKAIKKYKRNSKIILTLHSHSLICPNYCCYNYNKKVVCYKCANSYFDSHILSRNCDRRGIIYSFFKYVENKVHKTLTNDFKLYDVIITPSEYLQSVLRKSKYEFNNVITVPNPVDTEKIIEPYYKKDVISYIGRFSEIKNVDSLIMAFSELIKIDRFKNVKLNIIGDGEEKNNYERLIEKLKLDKHVYISEKFLNKDELKKYLRDSKIIVLPTKCPETFGISVLEAVSYGAFPIVQNIGAQSQLLKDLNFGLSYSKNNVESLKGALIEGLLKYDNNDVDISRMNELIINNYSAKKYQERVINLYKKVVRNECITYFQ